MKTSLLLVALAAPLVPRSDSVSLVARHAQGDVFEERERFWSSTTGAAKDDEANRPSFSWSEARARAARGDGSLVARESLLEDEVLAVDHGARTKIRRTFLTSTSTLGEPDAADSTTRAPFEGQTIVLVADGDGTRLVGEIDGEEELTPSDLDLSPRWELALPSSPVEIGDTWTLPEIVAAHLLEPLTARKATASCKLARVEASESGPVACVQLDLHGSTPGASGGTTEIESTGLVRWDIQGAHLIEVTLSGEIHASDGEGNAQTRRFGLVHETRRIE
jgi:hypothetical protein